MARIKMKVDGFDKILRQLQQLGAATRQITEDALQTTFDIVTPKAEQAAQNANLPAHGKYSKGRLLGSLKKKAVFHWNGTECEVSVGFDIHKGGLPSIFMLYGTPRYMKNQAMEDAFFGAQTEAEIRKAQEEVLYKALDKALGADGLG